MYAPYLDTPLRTVKFFDHESKITIIFNMILIFYSYIQQEIKYNL